MGSVVEISAGYAKYYRQREVEACQRGLIDPLPWSEAVELFGLADRPWKPSVDVPWSYLEYEPLEQSDAAKTRQE